MGTILSVVKILFTIMNVLFLVALVLGLIFIYPKVKIIMAAISAFNNLSSNITTSAPCAAVSDINALSTQINAASQALTTLKTYPLISGMIPDSIVSSINSMTTSLQQIPQCGSYNYT